VVLAAAGVVAAGCKQLKRTFKQKLSTESERTGESTMSKFVRVASASELSVGEGKVVNAEGQSIALFNVDGNFSAIDNDCTHVGSPLGEGA
jgi:hypothetical protein